MSNLHDFLVEHAMFPFPQPNEGTSADATDISLVEVPLLEREWKANHVVRDHTLVQKLCSTLENILGDTTLGADAENDLLSRFSPKIQFNRHGQEKPDWTGNASESHSWVLFAKGVLEALGDCLCEYGGYNLLTETEQVAFRGSSRIDYVLSVDGKDGGLLQVKSPSVMNNVRGLLPQNGIELTWARGQTLAPKVLTKAALILGLRQMEWLFITCHNYWVVCRLVRDDHHPFLAYSPMISIDHSSVPFRALLGAIMSVVRNVPVEPNEFNPNMELDTLFEQQDEGPSPTDDIDDGSPNSASSGEEIANDSSNTRNTHRTGHRTAESRLMITSSSQHSPEFSQVWIHLRPFSNNTLPLPQCAKIGNRRLWLTCFVGSGSTGNVWKCRFDGSGDFFAVKVVEVLRPADADKRQRLRDEFNIYLALEQAYQSRQLHHRIAPRCYGAFEGNGVAVLVLDLCDGVLNEWGALSDSERSQVYKLARDLHRLGISHGDLEPQNIARTREGGFCLIDFSEGGRHTCKGSKVHGHFTHLIDIRQPHLKNRCVMNCEDCEAACGTKVRPRCRH
ncbi:uncharacterized protein LACBIDRAFT_313890 [Laccaria bicolor S238N-H82]|uniref:Protein kinase domain-containing protein n=1 Tax=Laccaria bicolor (strain S238N-H82 / ATCC MYA-4686) TaxID=486041 RepID=B0D128_LACBS|nr:uncharacterized protein LACBIDRAFT_313890 [Laccaria bicolor S238N-H82]EDR11560.1 hypothetical protein LACBIDRAFT_313890 [Laccaria bicolor S238N-H82]|eukprot:XP_001877457.1 hypothetical protein LACBIDRAFT_313890 [Laccaria bicolor S238N-H82]